MQMPETPEMLQRQAATLARMNLLHAGTTMTTIVSVIVSLPSSLSDHREDIACVSRGTAAHRSGQRASTQPSKVCSQVKPIKMLSPVMMFFSNLWSCSPSESCDKMSCFLAELALQRAECRHEKAKPVLQHNFGGHHQTSSVHEVRWPSLDRCCEGI